MDEAIYENSVLSQTENFKKFAKRDILYFTDSNQGNYASSQVQFQMADLSNQDSMNAFPESSTTVPYVIRVSSTEDLADDDYMLTLKNGVQQILSSVSFSLDNQELLNITENINTANTFKILSQSSVDDERNLFDSIGFALDSSDSIEYTTGRGEGNGALFGTLPAIGDTVEGNKVNTGFIKRCEKYGFDPTSTETAKVQSLATTIARRKSHRVRVSAKIIEYHLLVTIPFKFMTPDLVDKLPLCKGSFLKMNLNIHSGSTSFSVNHTTKAVTNLTSTTRFGVLPFMVSQPGNSWNTTADCDITIVSGIASAGGTANDMIGSCTCNIVTYTARPEAELEYLQSVPSKTIDYQAIHTNKLSNIAANARFQFMVTSSHSRMRGLLIAPSLASVVNGAALPATSGGLVSCAESPFSSSPATCMKMASLINLQIKVGHKSLWETPRSYDYDMAMSEMRLGASGILGLKEWSSAYGYIYVDLSRYANDGDDMQSKGLEVIGTNNSLLSCDYNFFLFYENSFTLNVSTGKVSKVSM